MGINYQRLYDYRLSGVDQALRRPSGPRSPSTRTARPAGLPGSSTRARAGVSSSTRFPLLSGGRWAYLGVKPG